MVKHFMDSRVKREPLPASKAKEAANACLRDLGQMAVTKGTMAHYQTLFQMECTPEQVRNELMMKGAQKAVAAKRKE